MRKGAFIIVCLLLLFATVGCFGSGKGAQEKEPLATSATETGNTETDSTTNPTTGPKSTEAATTETNDAEQFATQSTEEQIPVDTKPQESVPSFRPGENETPGDPL